MLRQFFYIKTYGREAPREERKIENWRSFQIFPRAVVTKKYLKHFFFFLFAISSFNPDPFTHLSAGLMHIAGTTDMPSSSGLQMQTPLITSSNSLLDDQKLCAVCNDHAICQHYGARTCEGCKGFFKVGRRKTGDYYGAGCRSTHPCAIHRD